METALLKVHNDLIMDRGKVTELTLLASSAAFVSINHAILMARLFLWYGLSGVALSWYTYYPISLPRRRHGFDPRYRQF